MKLNMIVIMATILVAGFIFAIRAFLLAAGKTSRHERKLFREIQNPENDETELRLVK